MNVADDKTKGLVLVVDDEPLLRSACQRTLTLAGFEVVAVGSGEDAIFELTKEKYDAILSDIAMPGIDGLQLLRLVRERDLDIPVVLMTGAPTLDSALRAVEFGALRYLVKPFQSSDLVQLITGAVQLHRFAKMKRRALELLGSGEKLIGDRAGLEGTFQRALSTIWIAYQPIIGRDLSTIVGYEALVRPTEPALPHPSALFDAAERLGVVHTLGRTIRKLAAEPIIRAAGEGLVFINLHPQDLMDDELYSASGSLASIAGRTVLEITERASLEEVSDLRDRVRTLKSLGFRLAVDDLGAGYAGLTSFATIEPDIVKLDMSLIRDVHVSSVKQKLISAMTVLAHDLGMQVVAEGIELAAERDALVGLGCDMLQGFFFAKPDKPFPTINLPAVIL